MKFNTNTHFEISSTEIKEIAFALAKGFVKVQEWKHEQDEKETKQKTKTQMDRRMQPIAKKFREDFKRDMDRFDSNLKRDMDRFNKRHSRNLKAIRELNDDIDKKMNDINIKCGKKSDDIDVDSLPDDIKRQIAIDYLKKHPLSEDKQKRIADEYIRKYGVIK